MNLYCVRDKKSAACEYFLGQTHEEAFRLWFVMVSHNPQMFSFLDDFELVCIAELPDVREYVEDAAIVADGSRLKSVIESRKKECAEDGK